MIPKQGSEFDRGDLARAIEERDGLPHAAVHLYLEKVAAILPEILGEHGRIEIAGLGVFTLGQKYRKEEGQFVPTGKKKIRFRPAADLNRAVGIED